jgi:GNAT superfamily N-acetyltransferase
MGVSVRVAGDGDAGVVRMLRRSWVEETVGEPIEDPDFDAAFAAWWDAERDSRTFFVADVDGAPVGMANVKRYARMPSPGAEAGVWGYVGNVYVRAEHRDARVGAALMETLIAWTVEHGYDHLRLAPTVRSIPFYERLGFTQARVLQRDP